MPPSSRHWTMLPWPVIWNSIWRSVYLLFGNYCLLEYFRLCGNCSPDWEPPLTENHPWLRTTPFEALASCWLLFLSLSLEETTEIARVYSKWSFREKVLLRRISSMREYSKSRLWHLICYFLLYFSVHWGFGSGEGDTAGGSGSLSRGLATALWQQWSSHPWWIWASWAGGKNPGCRMGTQNEKAFPWLELLLFR